MTLKFRGWQRKAATITGSNSSDEHYVGLGREVAEEGALGDLDLLDDLLHGGRVVALRPEKPKRVGLDRGSASSPFFVREARFFAHLASVVTSSAIGVSSFRSGNLTRGTNTSARRTPANAIPDDTLSEVSMPCTNAACTDCVRVLDLSAWATASPPKTLWRTAVAAAAGKRERSSRAT